MRLEELQGVYTRTILLNIRFYRRAAKTERIQIENKLISKAAASESSAVHDMLDMWDVLIYT